MTRVILDTSVLIADAPDGLDGELAISSVSLAELHFGLLVATSATVRANRLARLTRITARFVALPVDDAVAASYGRLAAAVADVGRSPRPRALDLLIAATAHAHQAALYTRNAADLRGIEDLVDIRSL